jgi:hypothetical protein
MVCAFVCKCLELAEGNVKDGNPMRRDVCSKGHDIHKTDVVSYAPYDVDNGRENDRLPKKPVS